MQAIKQHAYFNNIVWLAQGAQFADHLQHGGAALHVTVQAINHHKGDFGEVAAHFLTDALAGVMANQGAEQPAQAGDQQGDQNGEAATQAVR